jgi:hypothetical protein
MALRYQDDAAGTAVQHENAIDDLTRRTELPREVVREIYMQELDSLRGQAAIATFLSVFTMRRVADRLRRR